VLEGQIMTRLVSDEIRQSGIPDGRITIRVSILNQRKMSGVFLVWAGL